MTSHVPTGTQAPVDPDNPEAAMREARQRFVAAFPRRSDFIALMLSVLGTVDRRGPLPALREVVHRMAGLAGMLGFPTVSIRAHELDEMLDGVDSGVFDASAASRTFDALGQAFTDELANPPAWVGTDLDAGSVRRVMVVENDEDQREVVSINLRAAGYVVIPVPAGDLALKAALDHRPDLILLDANLPGMDGYTVCRLVKAHPELVRTPLIFMTVRASFDDRMAGLMLGADDYLFKPVDMPELMLRIQVLLQRHAHEDARLEAGVSAQPPAVRELDYTSFATLAREQLDQLPTTLVLMKEPESPTRGTVVVAGDDSEVTDLIDGHLRAAGYQTILAANGHQALVAIDQHSPDLAIVDLMMPRVTGFDLLTALQRRTARPRVIVVSARGHEQDVTRAFALGADDYVAKPINPHELLARTERLFR